MSYSPAYLYAHLGSQAYDPGRQSVLAALAPNYESISAAGLCAILNSYSYDPGRAQAVSFLDSLDKLRIEQALIPEVLRCMSYDPGRNQILPYLIRKIDCMLPRVYIAILNEFSYDPGRLSATRVLPRCNISIQELRNAFSYVSSFLPATQSLGYTEEQVAPYRQENSNLSSESIIVNGIQYGSNDLPRHLTLPAPYENEPPAAPGRDTCIICLERAPSTIVKRCNHVVMCVTCSLQIGSEPNPVCPSCRGTVEAIERIYLP